MKLGMEVLERKFLKQYGGFSESEYWWFAEQCLLELAERD